MDMSELEDYHQAIRDAQDSFPEITVLAGLECEDFDDCRSFYEDEILGLPRFEKLRSFEREFSCCTVSAKSCYT